MRKEERVRPSDEWPTMPESTFVKEMSVVVSQGNFTHGSGIQSK